jgi:predicted permease
MRKRTSWLRRARNREADALPAIEEEVAFHLAMREEEALGRGASPVEARAEAQRAFGDRQRIEDELRRIHRRRGRRERRSSALEGVRVDLRQSLRAFTRRPAVPALVVLTLALGMGATTAVYTLFDRVVLNPLPVQQPERVYVLRGESEGGSVPLAYPMVKALRETARGWESIAAQGEMDVTARVGAFSDQLTAALVTGDYFGTLGVRPALGRLLQPADEAAPGSTPYVVLSDVLWRRAFGGDPAVLGRTIRINTQPFTVAGVAPAGFRGTDLSATAELWLPITMVRSIGSGGIFSSANVLETENLRWLRAIGRLRTGAAAPAAIAELETRFVARQRALPEPASALGPKVIARLAASPVQEAATGRSRADLLRLMAILWAVVATCLVIACVNVANLLLLRAADRWRELGIRMALGAGRGRLFRHLALESLTLALVAGAAGLVVARAGIRLLSTFSLPGDIALADAWLAPDRRVLAFAVLLSVATAVVFGLAPAVWASRPALMRGLREARHGAAGRWRGGNLLVAAQVALSVVLVVGALLFTRSLREGLSEDLGYRLDGIAALSIHPSQSGYTGAAANAFLGRLVEALADQPGIEAAALAAFVPPGDAGLELPVAAAGTGRQATGGRLAVNPVTADYLTMLGVPLLGGRMLEPRDERDDGPAVAVVTARAARELWPDEDPIGRTLHLFPGYLADAWTVVGTVADARFGPLGEDAPSVFLPHARFAGPTEVTLLARSSAPAARTLALMRRTIRDLDPDLPVFHARPLDDQLARILMPQRMGATLLGLFAALAIIVSGIGMYATVAYDGARRRRELGIRAALGARRRQLASTILSRAAASVLAGSIVGLIAAALLTEGLRAFLYGVTPHEPVSYLLAPIVLGTVAALATWLPLYRAARVDPALVMRDDG